MTYIFNLFRKKIVVGKLGEDEATKFLIDKGHKVLRRNFRIKMGEVDIVSLHDNVLHIVEVKTSKSQNIRPEENMNSRKISKVFSLAHAVKSILEKSKEVSRETKICVDFVGVMLDHEGKLREIIYLENI